MTAFIVRCVADVIGLPGSALFELAVLFQSRPLGELALALKWPGLRLHLFALELDDSQ